jgi:hypothetical protein
MQTKNLDIYGSEPIPWSRPKALLEGFAGGPEQETWLSTTDPDGGTHLTGVGAVWHDDRFWFTSGPGTRKSRNIAANPTCAIAVGLKGLDLVVEGRARRVTDGPTLERLAAIYRESGWNPSVKDGAFTAEYSAPSAGRPPWYVYELVAERAYGVASEEPHGASRWTF